MSATTILTLCAGIAIGATAGYLGSLMLGRRMSLVAGPLGHLTLPGIALAMVYGVDISLGAFPFVLIGIVVIWALEQRTRLPMEALTAVVFATGVATAFLFLPVQDAEAALIGDIGRTTPLDAGITIMVCALVAITLALIYPRLVLINISEDLASSEGVNVGRYNLVYLLLIALIVALGVKMVGGLLTAALVAIPPSAARNISRNLKAYVTSAIVIGATSALIGIIASSQADLPAGPLVILASGFIFLATLFFIRR